MKNLPPEVAALLQHGAALTSTVAETVGHRELDRLLASGTLRPFPRIGGVLVHPTKDDRWTAYAAVQLRCPGAAASRRLACWLFRAAPFDTPQPAHVEYLSSKRSRLAEVSHTATLPIEDVGFVAGIRVTSPARTLADLGTVCDRDLVERVGEQLLHKSLTTEDQLYATADRLRRRGRRGVAALDQFLKRRGRGTPPTESDLETRFLQASRALGFPEPTYRQYPVARPGLEPLRIDFAWRTAQDLILVEVDGAATHANPDALVADLRRQNALQGLRPVLLRFTAEEIDRQTRYIEVGLAPWLAQRQVQGVEPHFGQPAA